MQPAENPYTEDMHVEDEDNVQPEPEAKGEVEDAGSDEEKALKQTTEQETKNENTILKAFDEINGDIDDIDTSLIKGVASYKNVREKVDQDMVKLCAHYVLGTTSSPAKGKTDIGFISSKVSPIKKAVDSGTSSPQYVEQNEEADKGGIEEGTANEDKYRDALLLETFWSREKGKLSYHKDEEPQSQPTKYPEPQRPAQKTAKPAKHYTALFEKYGHKF